MSRMTAKASQLAVVIMQRIISHPCAKPFLTIQGVDGITTTDLSTIFANLLTNEYQTVGEWRKDMKSIVVMTESLHGKGSHIANCALALHGIFEKEYKRLVSISFSRWGKMWQELTGKLEDLFRQGPPDIQISSEIQYEMWRNQHKILNMTPSESQASAMKYVQKKLASQKIERLYIEEMDTSCFETFELDEPPPIPKTSSSSQEMNHAVVFQRPQFYDPLPDLLGFYTEEEDADDTMFMLPTQELDHSGYFTMSRTPGKTPRSDLEPAPPPPPPPVENRVKKPTRRVRISVGRHADNDEYKSRTKVRGRGRGRARGRSRRSTNLEWDDTSEYDETFTLHEIPRVPAEPIQRPLTEQDYNLFMVAVCELRAHDEAQTLAQIIIENEPGVIDMADHDPEINLERLREDTVQKLIYYVKIRYQERGLTYPDHC